MLFPSSISHHLWELGCFKWEFGCFKWKFWCFKMGMLGAVNGQSLQKEYTFFFFLLCVARRLQAREYLLILNS